MKNLLHLTSAISLTTAVLIFYSISAFAQSANVKLNENAFAYAQGLITQRHFVLDKKNDWGAHQPTAQEENDFIRDHGFAEYEKWHLGIDATHAQNRKAGYKFPFGDFKNIHRCALLAVKSRAHQYGHVDIENAAERLLQMMEAHK
jgi:hypothetical protein